MLNEKQMERLYRKLLRYETTLEKYFFKKVDTLEFAAWPTDQRLHTPPEQHLFRPIAPGDEWGGEDTICWFSGKYIVPEKLAGETLFLMPRSGGYESLLWINGMPRGIFASKILVDTHGNHYCDLLCQNAQAGTALSVMLESYAGRYVIGTQPLIEEQRPSYQYTYQPADICIKRQDVIDFVFDLHTLNQLVEMLPSSSFRRAQVLRCLKSVFAVVCLSPEDVAEEVWRPLLAQARLLMHPVLEQKNAESAPVAGIVGHSHMDTAWLWTIDETVKKCARTFSNQLQLMKQYPEYHFIQSSAYHLEMIRRNYPTLFEEIRQQVRAGRYEPNGGVWIECDCNLTGGESMVRQFLWGQRYTQKFFDYTSDCFWLPDTFGYSAALPQIMKGCGVNYFLTTKLSWNDTNKFPYESFCWEGIDGSRVLTHFNTTHCATDPKALIGQLEGPAGNCLQDKTIASRRLIAFGFGDGGGGPQFEHLEMARRTQDLDGCPRAVHTSVSDFMRELEQETTENGNLPLYAGELYLELHRGTLTTQSRIKKNNRKAEQLLHDLEWLTVSKAVQSGRIASGKQLRVLWETLLVNQFHDILPGTCIAPAMERSRREMAQLLKDGQEMREKMLAEGPEDELLAVNSLGFVQKGLLEIPEEILKKSLPGTQHRTRLDGSKVLLAQIAPVPAFSAVPLQDILLQPDQEKWITFDGDRLQTPFYQVHFDPSGAMDSLIVRSQELDLCREGGRFNSFLLAEDLPLMWDNWDIDADLSEKWERQSILLSRQVISQGEHAFVLRSSWQIGCHSVLEQDMIFYRTSMRIDFENRLTWNEKHRFLKVQFDTALHTPFSRQEIQFGCCQRSTSRNDMHEQAMFEVVQHKYTDLSEPRQGLALLNDCKYGVSVQEGCICLSLCKGGTRPDESADQGVHEFRYALLPHVGGFSAEKVVHPAYSFNQPLLAVRGTPTALPLSMTAPNVLIETIKPCEEEEKALILRCYECEGSHALAQLDCTLPMEYAELTDMLERPMRRLSPGEKIPMTPFQILTLKVKYK